MTGITLSRRREMIAAVIVLGVCLVAVVTLTWLTRPAQGRLVHDDTLRTTTVEKTWHERIGHGGPCLTIEFRGELTGNARSTWGLDGPTTVWEHLRVHNTRIRVDASELSADGTCGEPAEMQSLTFTLVRKTDDGWKRVPNTGSTFTRTDAARSVNEGFGGRLGGDAYDRGESFRTVLGVYVEPHWSIHGGNASDGVQVEHTVELRVD